MAKLYTETSLSKQLNACKLFIKQELHDYESPDALLFSALLGFEKIFKPMEFVFLVIGFKNCWKYSRFGKNITKPFYKGFYNHLKIIQNNSRLAGNKYRTVPSLNKIFDKPGGILGLPFSLISSKKIWILINQPADRYFSEKMVRKVYRNMEMFISVIEKADYSEVDKIAGKYVAQEEAVSVLIHQLKSPLSSFKRVIEIIGKDSPGYNKMLEQCLQNLDRTQSMINDYLDYIKIRSADLIPVNLGGVVRQIRTFFVYALKSADIKLKISNKLKDPEDKVRGNFLLIFMVLQNLIENSIKAVGHGGKVYVDLRRDSREANMPQVNIEVKDTGAGIPEELIDRIFDPFFSGFKNGHGLGLSICKRIIDLHGGEIKYLRNEKDGSGKFLIKLYSAQEE